MKYLNLIYSIIIRYRKRRKYLKIYKKFKNFTMISQSVFVDNLQLSEQVFGIDGCVVECGVWRGGMSAGLAALIGEDREFFLFDSFEGLPVAQDIDGKAAIEWQNDTQSKNYYDNCSAPPEFAQCAMRLAGVQSFHLFEGWFDKTIPDFNPSAPIVLLRLDADWYESTITCLNYLYDYVAPGGLIVLDDYYTWDGCSRALHDFLSQRSSPERIRSYGGVCYIKKTGPAKY